MYKGIETSSLNTLFIFIINQFFHQLPTITTTKDSIYLFHLDPKVSTNNRQHATLQDSRRRHLRRLNGFCCPDRKANSQITNLPKWTLEGMKRSCTKDNSHCTWSFHLNAHENVPGAYSLPCTHEVAGPHVKISPPTIVGDYSITSFWNPIGFTTIMVVENMKALTIWAGYTDHQVEAGKVIKPDQSYAVTDLG